ncbi:MAG TPA: DoxX family protein [Eudoraea sp.]|nr:DoxX family protein [Eudoraea sp.]
MESTYQISKGRLWTSYILQGLIVLLFLFGAVSNILQTEMAVKGATDLGYSSDSVLYMGLILLISTLLYLIPKTAIFGAVLLTGWLGGAVATHIMHKDPLFNMIFPVVFGILIWLCIWLRNNKLQQLMPFVR